MVKEQVKSVKKSRGHTSLGRKVTKLRYDFSRESGAAKPSRMAHALCGDLRSLNYTCSRTKISSEVRLDRCGTVFLPLELQVRISCD